MKDFGKYAVENLKRFLPVEYAAADLRIMKTLANNDTEKETLYLELSGSAALPVLDVDVMRSVCGDRFSADEFLKSAAGSFLTRRTVYPNKIQKTEGLGYEDAKEHLVICVGRTASNRKRLEGLAGHEIGEFTVSYILSWPAPADLPAMFRKIDPVKVVHDVRQDMLVSWGVTEDRVYRDALAVEDNMGPVLIDFNTVTGCYMLGSPFMPDDNLFRTGYTGRASGADGLLCLSNRKMFRGAHLMFRADILEKIGELVGGDFYVLPSSVDEVLIWPDNGKRDKEKMNEVVRFVNKEELAPEQRLADSAYRYDCERRVLVNTADGKELVPEQGPAHKTGVE